MPKNSKDDTQDKSYLKDEDAKSGAPEESSIAGEEDPGSALEDWVTRDERTRRKPQEKKSD